MASRNTTNDRRARIEQMRRAEQSRERRNRILTVGISAVVVAGLVGFGVFVLNKESEEKEQRVAEAKAPVQDEKSWDAKKLGRNHVETAVSYEMKPPVGGDHSQVWMNCNGDVYKEAIPEVNAVHSLEHGAVWVTYTDKAAKGDVDKLADKVKKTPYTLMSPYKDQQGPIMLSAWGKQLTVDSADDKRVSQFFTKYVQGPQTPEPGAACTGGLSGK
ncbi:membrane protein [Streptomyces kurssanovii]|nr:membrane protein [Streptomyces kurssanovii]